MILLLNTSWMRGLIMIFTSIALVDSFSPDVSEQKFSRLVSDEEGHVFQFIPDIYNCSKKPERLALAMANKFK